MSNLDVAVNLDLNLNLNRNLSLNLENFSLFSEISPVKSIQRMEDIQYGS